VATSRCSEALGGEKLLADMNGDIFVRETIPRSFGLEAATQGCPDGTERYGKIFPGTPKSRLRL